MREIQPQQIEYQEVTVPGSKSYTHRMLIAAGLADGRCFIHNSLASDDTGLTLNAVQRLGARVEKQARRLVIDGCNGRFQPCAAPIFLGNSGTSMRLLTAVVALGQGVYTLTGTPRMSQRPIRDLVDGMKQIGV
ncbi:MAG: 3-phosphoshikimate 1-carboxyvinyltransferase, partial [Desulfobacterales bacterium]